MKVAAPLVLAPALFVSLTACAAEPPKYGKPEDLQANCTPDCVVTVIVPSTCGSGIRVAPDPIVVKRGQTSTIKWNVTGRWQFDRTNGIYVHRGEKAFSKQERAADGRSFTVVIRHDDPVVFKYDVNLIGPDGRPCQYDPIIVNW